LSIVIAAFLMTGLMALPADAATRMAFGYLANQSKDSNYDYLETIMPNSFASSAQNIFRVKVLNPNQINRILEEYNLKLEREYRPHELAGIARTLSADYFIFGSFKILARDNIKINIHFYCLETDKIFSFSNTGKMEAEIFKLVDRIANIMINFIREEKFFSKTIPKGARIGILTNLTGEDLNSLYVSFLNSGYKVASIQANSLHNNLTPEAIKSFKYVSAGENAYQMISDPRKMKFLRGTWTGRRYDEKINQIKKTYRAYDLDFIDTKSSVIDRLATYHHVDTVLIIGFNQVGNSAWVRCFDARTKDLIWMEPNISGSLDTICSAMINKMSSDATPPNR
jgi:hypothetical protein